MAYSRDKDLKQNFNEFFGKFGVNDLYSKLSGRDLIELKKVLSCINNIITLRTTRDFVEKLYADGFLTKSEREQILEDVDSQHANANGFDVQYDGKNKKIIAEVKCNIPVNVTSFGAAQEEGILEDIEHLLKGKKKSDIPSVAPYYKFMVVMDCSDHIDECVAKIIKKTEHVKLYSPAEHLDTNNIYIMYV